MASFSIGQNSGSDQRLEEETPDSCQVHKGGNGHDPCRHSQQKAQDLEVPGCRELAQEIEQAFKNDRTEKCEARGDDEFLDAYIGERIKRPYYQRRLLPPSVKEPLKRKK